MKPYILIVSLSLLTLGLAPSAVAEDGTYSCTTTVGLANPVVGVSADLSESAGVSLGGCNLVTLESASVVESVDPADGCSANVDTTGDGLSDATPEAGETYEAGAQFFVTCDLGTVEAISSLSLSPA